MVFIRKNLKETALARKKGMQTILFLHLEWLEVPSGPDRRLKGSRAASLIVSPVWGGEGEVEKWGQPKSSLLCVSVETTKATKRRSYPFCVSVSWETAGRSCIWVLLFSPLRAINR